MAKELLLTNHALLRSQSRKIRLKWIEQAVFEPEWSAPDPYDAEVERRFCGIAEFGGRILRVACVETEPSIRVISVLFDRKARRPS